MSNIISGICYLNQAGCLTPENRAAIMTGGGEFADVARSNEIFPNSICIKLLEKPEEKEGFIETLFPLSRQIEQQYCSLTWPAQMQNIVVLTELCGGLGDMATAAKAIGVMQRVCPTLTFDWILRGEQSLSPAHFLTCDKSTKINIRKFVHAPSTELPGDFLLAGPTKLSFTSDYIESKINKKIIGPAFCFLENAHDLCGSFNEMDLRIKTVKNPEEKYSKLHSYIFPSSHGGRGGYLRMGLDEGSGVFLDKDRMEAPLSREACCPSYLLQIQDERLRRDILKAMHIDDDKLEPDYDLHSFNFGYAHHLASCGKFIDCVAVHEKDKHVVIVLNQSELYSKSSSKDFCDQTLTSERLGFLNKKGYSKIDFRGEEDVSFTFEVESSQAKKSLTIIVRASFIPKDMKQLQLAAERLLCTGDNSAVEAWCARCKLYLYEDVNNGGCKWRFLQQQVDLAKTISANVSQLLAVFGGDKRLLDRSLNQPFSSGQMADVEKLLNDPNLSKETLQFCNLITKNFSFEGALEGALKRTAWHHLIPALPAIEAEVLGLEFQSGLLAYVENPQDAHKNLVVQDLSRLGKRVQEVVAKYVLGIS